MNQETHQSKEIASGVNDSRPKLLSLLKDTSITRIVVEHRDRLTRFGSHYLETLLEAQGRTIEVVNPARKTPGVECRFIEHVHGDMSAVPSVREMGVL